MEQDSTKQTILQTAERLFAYKGYDAVGVQEIVTAAGITKPTLYYYFRSKRGLLEALVSTKGQKLTDTIAQAATYNGDFFNSLSCTLKAFIQFALENPDFFRLHCTLLKAPKESEPFCIYKPVQEQLSKIILNLFIEATTIFGNMKGKEELYSTLFHNNATSIAMSSVANGTAEPDDKTIYIITHSFIYGFAD